MLNFQTPDAADERGETAAWKVHLDKALHVASLFLRHQKRNDSTFCRLATLSPTRSGILVTVTVPAWLMQASRVGNLAVLETLSTLPKESFCRAPCRTKKDEGKHWAIRSRDEMRVSRSTSGFRLCRGLFS